MAQLSTSDKCIQQKLLDASNILNGILIPKFDFITMEMNSWGATYLNLHLAQEVCSTFSKHIKILATMQERYQLAQHIYKEK